MATHKLYDSALPTVSIETPPNCDQPDGYVQACTLGHVMPKKQADIHRRIHGSHCARGLEGHSCIGKVTIDSKAVTLQCERCGDGRMTYDPVPGIPPPQRKNVVEYLVPTESAKAKKKSGSI